MTAKRSTLRRISTAVLFIGPWLVGFAALIVYPFIASLIWSFCRYDLLSPPQFVGLENYRMLASELARGERFGHAVFNTCYYALVSVPLSIVLGITLATVLSWPVRGRSVYRTLVYLPSVVPAVAVSVLWLALLDPRDGLVNAALGELGLPQPGWFRSPAVALWPPDWFRATAAPGSKDGLILASLWGVGNFAIIYLAALADVPRELYEAAEIDGASRWVRFRRIALPLPTPVIFFNLVMGLIQAVQAFTQVYITSDGQGAPADASLMVSLYLFLAAFKELEMGYASAMAWSLFVFVLAATVALARWSRGWVFYQGAAR
jgi:multiple sugar transport system permease protein